MLALGMSNIFGSFVRSMPVTGSFTRTAVNNASGVQTCFGNFVTGGIVILALAFLTKTFYYIPKATLAAVVICAMFYLFDYEAIKTLWRSKSSTFLIKLDHLICIVHYRNRFNTIFYNSPGLCFLQSRIRHFNRTCKQFNICLVFKCKTCSRCGKAQISTM